MATLTTTIRYSEPAGSIVTSLGTPGPAGPGVPPGGSANQILAKIDGVSYNTEWVTPQDDSAVWGQITGDLANQYDLQAALDAKLDSSTAASTYLPLAGGYITGDIQSLNGSEFRTFQTPNSAIIRPYQISLADAVGTLTVDAGGVTFNSSPYKQTAPFLGLDGYATESWVTTQLGSYLTISSASATYYPLTNPAGYITLSALSGYATESWVTGLGYLTASDAALTYFPLSGGALNSNSNVTISDSSSAADSELAGWGLGVQLTADHAQGTTVEYNGLHTYAAGSFVNINPTGITFGDSTVQTTAGIPDAPSDNAYYSRRNAGWEQTLGQDAPFNGLIYGRRDGFWAEVSSGGAVWGSITGDLPDQTDLQGALDAKYDASNPAGFITAGDLAGYATESWVTSQGYLTTAILDGYAQLAGSTFTGAIEFDPYSQGRIMIGGGYDVGGGFLASRFNLGTGFTASASTTGDFWFNGTNLQYENGSIQTVASQSWVTTNYAQLSGATFTGKVNLATISTSSPSVNLGGQCDSAPASATNGDLWISNAAAPKLTYRMGGVNYNLPVLNQFNTFTNQMVIDTASSTTAALRVTQRGAGNAIEVEDSTTPDATKFAVDQFGKVGIGVAPDATAALKIDANGISFNGLVFNPTATSAHTGGSDTLDLLVTINGTAYRIGLRPA